MKSILTVLFCILSATVSAQPDTTQQIIKGRNNSRQQQAKPYVILISADGFRYDYARKYQAKHLLALSEAGVSAASMLPAFPSITFPNHYTLVTGLYPAHHGLVSNKFYAPQLKRTYNYKSATATEGLWYGGTPLWVLAEQQHMLSASFYWVGSEAPVKGVLPTYYYHYNEQIKIHNRIEAVKHWLQLPAAKRPHLITIYFPEVDHAGHQYGPESGETAKQVHFIDSAVNELVKAISQTKLKVNYLFVSDHGMITVSGKNALQLPSVIDTNKFIVSGDAALVELYARATDTRNIGNTYRALLRNAKGKGYSVYLKSNMPAYLHYGAKDDLHHHIGDILLIPHFPYIFQLGKGKINPGFHGYDPHAVKAMGATFYAWGPAFKKRLKIRSFENVNVYPIITRILGLHYTNKIDGTAEVANEVLMSE